MTSASSKSRPRGSKKTERQSPLKFKPSPPAGVSTVRHHIGILLQMIALVGVLALVPWQLSFGFPLVMMPACTVAGMLVFWLGHILREGGKG
jgi:hypothetical protein